jgi:hypothetical protein
MSVLGDVSAKMSRKCTCESPDGYLAEEGVPGTELRDGESSALRMVCSWRPMLFDTVDESEGSCQSERGKVWDGVRGKLIML